MLVQNLSKHLNKTVNINKAKHYQHTEKLHDHITSSKLLTVQLKKEKQMLSTSTIPLLYTHKYLTAPLPVQMGHK